MLRLPDALPRRLVAHLRQPRARLATGAIVLGCGLIVAQVASGTNRGAIERTLPARPTPAASVTMALPPVEPLTFRSVPPESARAINAATPFAGGPNPAAAPFRIKGAAAEEEKALTCLAAAAWYEAGDDTPGEQAVMQVVLNRLRHPAFPKTVCGVVFQGAERASGCQFTFACDGAMARRPSGAAWLRARLLARLALHGAVFAQVGWATHYHTEAVVPYWSATLAKNAQVGTHLFFRWQGSWGTPPAFTGTRRGEEQLDPRLAGYTTVKLAASPAPQALALAVGDDDLSLAGTAVDGARMAAVDPAPAAQIPTMPQAARTDTPH